MSPADGEIMPSRAPFPVSVLDLVPVGSGRTAREALGHTLRLAHRADRLGFARYWFAEHHGMPGIASSSPEILIAHVAAATRRIRVGSGGIMLPNHVPLQVAERFHTLEALHPGRIDLGIGRAPGTDQAHIRALRPFDANRFSEQLAELLALSRGHFPPDHPLRGVRVVPGDVPLPPIWLLGSSGASARLAGQLGMGYGFASHFSQASPLPAAEAYREAFQPSDRFPRPHFILAAGVVCAEDAEEADRLASSMDLAWVRLSRGELGLLPSPEEARSHPYTTAERSIVASYRKLNCVGTPDEVRAWLIDRMHEAGADEAMITSTIHDPDARIRSFELVANVFGLQGEG